MTYRIPLASSLALLLLAAPERARAQTACGDTECPKGYECKTEPLGCPAIDCAEGAACPPCEPSEQSYCSPLPCSSDADCDTGMSCRSEEVEECTGEARPCGVPEDGGAPECPPAPEPECTMTTVSACVPNWALPCAANADCGPGFTCEELEECGCTGSASGSGPDAPPTPETDTEPAPTPGDCTCRPSGEFACELVVTPCATDDDCVPGFTCVDNPEGVCSSSSDGTVSCEPGDPPRLCVPPYSDIFGRGGVSVGEDSEGSAPGGGAPKSADGDSASDSSESDSSGCSVASGRPATPGFLALVVAGLVAAFGLRRTGSGRRTARHG